MSVTVIYVVLMAVCLATVCLGQPLMFSAPPQMGAPYTTGFGGGASPASMNPFGSMFSNPLMAAGLFSGMDFSKLMYTSMLMNGGFGGSGPFGFFPAMGLASALS